jgi:hypothetical protein
MSIPVTSWLRAFFALQQGASDSRGFISVTEDDEEVARWPRTVGSDVVAIAAVFDPYVREQPLRFGGHGLARRWRSCVDNLERLALVAPRAEYAQNRAFWSALSAMAVYLHAERSPLPPPEIWDALCAQLAEPVELRNVGPKGNGPFKHFDNVKTFDDLYIEQFKYLRDQRGSDKLKPDAGAPGPEKIIPRTVNGDVVLLADYWSKQLGAVKKVFGHAGVEAEWKTATVDVDALARKGDPNVVYPKNNSFWRALQKTAIHVAVADEAPSTTDMVLDSLKTSVVNLPENIKAGAKAVVNATADVAHGVGKIANEAGKGLFAGFGTPLLVGAGLLGVFLISRNKRSAKAGA